MLRYVILLFVMLNVIPGNPVALMMNFEEISHIVSSFCSEHPSVTAAYVFGSVAKGCSENPKDVDVAVLLNPKDSRSFDILLFITAIEESLGCRADVVVLNRAGELLKYEVRRHGRLVFDRSHEFRKNFEIRSRKMYEDFLYLHKKYVNAVLYGGNKNG